MRFDVDLVQSEIPRRIIRNGENRLNPDFPHDGICAGNHFPAPPMSTRFFYLAGAKDSKVSEFLSPGIYCEWCLSVANKLKAYVKQNKELDFDPREEIEELLERAWQREGEYYG